MEQHPVPQNVTTFQFRLIGDMTIKQFGYLAGGAVVAYVFYKLPVPFFFSWPLAFLAALAGFGFAFVPVEDRPMDIWVMSFLKNIYSPTQFVWSHEQAPATPPPPQSARVVAAPPVSIQQTQQRTSTSAVIQNIYAPAPAGATPGIVATSVQSIAAPHLPTRAKTGLFDWILAAFRPHTTPPHAQTAPVMQTAAAIPTPSVTGRHLDITPPPTVVQSQPQAQTPVSEKAASISWPTEEKPPEHPRVLELQKQLMDVSAERDKMKHELTAARTPPAASPAPTPAPRPATTASTSQPVAMPMAPTAVLPKQPTVKIITPEGAMKAGLPRLTTFPNVVTGITRDSENNLLPGVLVTVKDKEGVPLRALKTNRLGQFAASTPITNGTYFVEIEDPRDRYTFDRVQITLNGSIVPALEIIAKSQKEVAREKLAKEIFGS